ncbi:hypothetical protein N9948_00530 [bacterium]|nr:hypothetical protein [bacterium]
MKTLIFILTSIIFLGCTGKKDKTKVELFIGNIAGSSQFTGGILVSAEKVSNENANENATFDPPVYYDLPPDNTVSIPHGSWKFYFVAWEGSNAYEGNIYCGHVYPILLQDESQTVGVTLSRANCYTNLKYKAMAQKRVSDKTGCPTGYVFVTGNNTLGTSDFCVMKYKAKNVASVPLSEPSGSHWTGILPTKAYDICNTFFEPGFYSNYALVSNDEWLTLARDVENVATNWSSGSVGVGVIARGWTAATAYGDAWENTTYAPSEEETCKYNTGANTCGATGTLSYRRTQNVSTGGEVWDLGANLFEWVDWDHSDSVFSNGPTTCFNNWRDYDTPCAAMLQNTPENATLNTTGIGRWFGDGGGAAMRGSNFNYGYNAGLYNLLLLRNTSYSAVNVGFRCVYRI